jgi:hypothetical protein
LHMLALLFYFFAQPLLHQTILLTSQFEQRKCVHIYIPRSFFV